MAHTIFVWFLFHSGTIDGESTGCCYSPMMICCQRRTFLLNIFEMVKSNRQADRHEEREKYAHEKRVITQQTFRINIEN